MTALTSIELDRDVVDAATKRAAEQGLSVAEYVSLLLRRAFERAPGEESVLVYDHVEGGGQLVVDRDVGESEENYQRRTALYDRLFG